MNTSDRDDYGVAAAPDTVRFERLLPGSAERLWAYLTEAGKRRQWLAGGEMEPRLGGRAELFFRHSDFTDEPVPERFRDIADGFHAHGRITAFDPPRVLGMTWPGDGVESEVVFELFPEGANVLLVITHRRLSGRAEMANVSGGWHAHLDVLAALLEGAETPPFWSRIERLEADYSQRYGRDSGGTTGE